MPVCRPSISALSSPACSVRPGARYPVGSVGVSFYLLTHQPNPYSSAQISLDTLNTAMLWFVHITYLIYQLRDTLDPPMRLSKKGEYALRAMIVLSLNYGKGPAQTREIARQEKIPEKFLEQILLTLKKSGLLESRRGTGGGYVLIKPPEEVTLAKVIRVIDGPLAPLSCVSTWAHVTCAQENECGLHKVMLHVRNAIAQILEGVTFADVCNKTKNWRVEHQPTSDAAVVSQKV